MYIKHFAQLLNLKFLPAIRGFYRYNIAKLFPVFFNDDQPVIVISGEGCIISKIVLGCKTIILCSKCGDCRKFELARDYRDRRRAQMLR